MDEPQDVVSPENDRSAPPSQQRRGIGVSRLMRPIRVRSHRFGTIHLRPLTVGDTQAVAELAEQELPPREFAARLIHHQLTRPSLDLATVRAWADQLLGRVVQAWAADAGGFRRPLDSNLPVFEAFQQQAIIFREEEERRVRALLSPTLEALRKQTFLLDAIKLRSFVPFTPPLLQITPPLSIAVNPVANWPSTLVSPILEGIQEAAQDLVRSVAALENGFLDAIRRPIIPSYQVGDFFRALPDFSGLLGRLAEIRKAHEEGEQVLDDTGYSFLGFTFLTSAFAEFAQVEPRVRGAAVTNTLLALTRRRDFEDRLRRHLEGSAVLGRRWPIVERAIKAHRERNYLLSTPPLLAQIEGIVADALILKGMVRPVGRRLYAKDTNGNLKLNRRGDRIELRGLGELVQHSDFQDHAVLEGLVEVTTDRLIHDRNGILHGRRTAYGRAKLSVIALLVLDMIAGEFVEFEAGRIAT
ncbi:MAG: hypothetical protein ACRDJW_01380 [Thermomicrobiales bacterium]